MVSAGKVDPFDENSLYGLDWAMTEARIIDGRAIADRLRERAASWTWRA